jgi:hypothetical protein
VTDFFSIFQPEDEAVTVDTLYETSSLDLDRETFTDIFQNNGEMGYAAIVKSVLPHFFTRGISTIKREDLENYRDKGIILKKIQETEITEEKVEVEDIVARE